MLTHLRRQFAYNAWANREVLSALRSHPSARPLTLFAHIVSAEGLWLERIRRRNQSLPVWPDFTLERCAAEFEQTTSQWQGYLDELSTSQLPDPVTYKNSKGQEWKSTISDVLTHVLLHSAYHRGQIASKMREEGTEPPYADFIHAARQGFIG